MRKWKTGNNWHDLPVGLAAAFKSGRGDRTVGLDGLKRASCMAFVGCCYNWLTFQRMSEFSVSIPKAKTINPSADGVIGQ